MVFFRSWLFLADGGGIVGRAAHFLNFTEQEAQKVKVVRGLVNQSAAGTKPSVSGPVVKFQSRGGQYPAQNEVICTFFSLASSATFPASSSFQMEESQLTSWQTSNLYRCNSVKDGLAPRRVVITPILFFVV